jgi:hypothetical protein
MSIQLINDKINLQQGRIPVAILNHYCEKERKKRKKHAKTRCEKCHTNSHAKVGATDPHCVARVTLTSDKHRLTGIDQCLQLLISCVEV